jgi:lipopolysaccharide export system protein LptA
MKRARHVSLILAALTFAPLIAQPAIAQTVTNAFGGLSESSKDPIDIESDVLVVHDKEKYASFRGNVKAVQGTTTLRARELKVHYVGGDRLVAGGKTESGGQAAAPAPETKVADAKGGGEAEKSQDTQITKIEAKGEVVITSDEDQTTTSDWALYDLPAQLVTVGGNVVLTQGKNVLKGDRLVIDLKTGESRFEQSGDPAAGGRIRAIFMPKDAAKGGEADGTKPGDAKPAAKETGSSGNKPAAEASEGTETGEPSDEAPWPLSPDRRP